MYMTVTTPEGARVNDGKNRGLTEPEAAADVKERNARAEALGIEARYGIADFVRSE